jgi:hypothetical protein
VALRRCFYEATGGYDPRWKRCEDADLWVRGHARFIYGNLQEPLLRYCIPGPQSIREIKERASFKLHLYWKLRRPLSACARSFGYVLYALACNWGVYQPRYLRDAVRLSRDRKDSRNAR